MKLTDEQAEEIARASFGCSICGAKDDGLQRYAVTVDGESLRMAPLLCPEHGARFLLRVGYVLGSLQKNMDEVFSSPSESPFAEGSACGPTCTGCRRGWGGVHCTRPSKAVFISADGSDPRFEWVPERQ